MTVTKQQVIRALATMRAGRSPADGNRAIRRILARFGAANISELREEHYAAAIEAVTVPTAANHYGSVTDIEPLPPRPPISRKNTHILPARVRSPLTLALEAELAKTRAKTKRSVPSGRANYGAPAHFGDQADDAPQPEYPAGTRMS